MSGNKKVKISELIPDDKNFNLGSEFGNSIIEKSLRKNGAGRSILLDKNNRIIAGNKTIENASAIGMDDIEIIDSDGTKIIAVRRTDIDLDSPEGREMALADNATAKASINFDFDLLSHEFEPITLKEYGIEIPETLTAEEDDFGVPDGGAETDIVSGDLFEIGKHRLLCGDSTNIDDLDKLINGAKIEAVLTDPPYGIGFKYDKYVDVKGEPYENFCEKWFNNLLTLTNNIVIFTGWSYNKFWFNKDPYDVFYWIVRNKHSGGKNSHYRTVEPVFMFKRFKKQFDFDYILNDSIKRADDYTHGCPKPAELIGSFIEKLAEKKEIVLDIFLGSGTTMLTAQQLERTCYGMELDPKYCQVIINRMLKSFPELEVKKNGEPYKQSIEK